TKGHFMSPHNAVPMTGNRTVDYSVNKYEDTGLLSTYLSGLFFGRVYKREEWGDRQPHQDPNSPTVYTRQNRSGIAQRFIEQRGIVTRIALFVAAWLITIITAGTAFIAARQCYLKKN